MTTSITSKSNKVKYLIVAFLWLAIWEGIALIINEEILFVSPLKVVSTLINMAGTKEYWEIIFMSILRVVGGFLIGYVFASILAALSFRFSFFKTFISPMIHVIKSTPVASFIILALMWTGKNFVPVLICILMVTPIVYSNVLGGLLAVDKNLLEMASAYKMKRLSKLKHIYIPSLLPFNAAAMGSGLGLCWKAGISAEVICRTMPSIGNSIWETKFYLLTDEMFAWTVTVVLLSVLFDKLLSKFLKTGKSEVKA